MRNDDGRVCGNTASQNPAWKYLGTPCACCCAVTLTVALLIRTQKGDMERPLDTLKAPLQTLKALPQTLKELPQTLEAPVQTLKALPHTLAVRWRQWRDRERMRRLSLTETRLAGT